MTTILLLFIFPIGMVFYWNERKSRGKYQSVFDDYIQKIDASSDLTQTQKLERVKELFLANRYEVVLLEKDKIRAERKIFSMGLFMMGLFFYLFYFFFFQKPHTIEYKIG